MPQLKLCTTLGVVALRNRDSNSNLMRRHYHLILTQIVLALLVVRSQLKLRLATNNLRHNCKIRLATKQLRDNPIGTMGLLTANLCSYPSMFTTRLETLTHINRNPCRRINQQGLCYLRPPAQAKQSWVDLLKYAALPT